MGGEVMVMKGETVATGAPLPYEGAAPEVLKSAAGWYIGYRDEDYLPYSRESGYYGSKDEALTALWDLTYSR